MEHTEERKVVILPLAYCSVFSAQKHFNIELDFGPLEIGQALERTHADWLYLFSLNTIFVSSLVTN